MLKKIMCEGFLNYTGYTAAEIDMKKLEKSPHKRKKMSRVRSLNRDMKPMPKSKRVFSYHAEWNFEEFTKLSYGLRPANRDEKWFICLQFPWMYFHRSWTGDCAYLLYLKRGENNYFVKEAWINPDLKFEEAYAVKFLDYLIDRLLLSKPVPFPFPTYMRDLMERAVFRHGAVGSSLANDEE